MGYAAVASLSHTIHLLLNYHHDYISHQFKTQIISLRKQTDSLESVFEDFPDRVNYWEDTIREIAERAEERGKGKYEVNDGFDELERVSEEMESIAKKVKGGTRRTEGGLSGLDEELSHIVDRLTEPLSALQIIPIVGMGGIGKTTLARKVYQDPLISYHFEVSAWCTVTQNFVMRRILLELLSCMNKSHAELESISNLEDALLKESLYRKLWDRRYLIVLDDVWNDEDMGKLRFFLPDNENGSRIIITTRNLSVARTAGFGCIHEMRSLGEEETWKQFEEAIFKGDPCPSQLEYLGRTIARGCRGHPLSIKVVSGILAADDHTEATWEDISQNINRIDSENFHEILFLSYTYLPHHLRPCFLYFGFFPEDHEINVSILIKIWIAEGFLNERDYQSFEETGYQHVEDLVRRGLASVSKRKSNGRIKSITIHDILLDMCVALAHRENFILHIKRYNWPQAMELQTCRRVSSTNYDQDFLKGVYGETVRTIILCSDDCRQQGINLSLPNGRLLRILDLSNVAYTYDLPDQVFELFHLRYLSFNCGFSISEAISNLDNLQTLIICPRENGTIFDYLPEGIWRMPQLRHLLVSSFKFPTKKEAPSALENLQILSRLVDFVCVRKDLNMIPNLKKLALLYTFRDAMVDYELHNLKYFQKLEILKIEMDCPMGKHKEMRCDFPPTLKKLSLNNVGLSWEDMKIVSLLPNLQVLKLRRQAFIGGTWETSEGGFSQLIFLLIDDSNLRNWITESSHFPRLKSLVLHRCWCLVEIPHIADIPTLESIEVDDYNDSLLDSARNLDFPDSFGNSSIVVLSIKG